MVLLCFHTSREMNNFTSYLNAVTLCLKSYWHQADTIKTVHLPCASCFFLLFSHSFMSISPDMQTFWTWYVVFSVGCCLCRLRSVDNAKFNDYRLSCIQIFCRFSQIHKMLLVFRFILGLFSNLYAVILFVQLAKCSLWNNYACFP